MNNLFLAGAVVLVMSTGAAIAQTTMTSETTTTVNSAGNTNVIIPPPPETLSVTRTQKSVSSDGTETDKTQTTYRNTDGLAQDTATRTTTAPQPTLETNSTWSRSTTTTTK